MNSQTPVIFIALARWDSAYSSTALALAKEMAKERPVFYIDNPFTWKDFISRYQEPQIQTRKKSFLKGNETFRTIPNFPENFTWVISPLVLPINFLPKGRLYDFLSKRNNRKIHQLLQRLISKYNLSEFILINVFNPFYGFDLPDSIKPKKYIYYCVDVMSQSVYIKKHGVDLERRMIKQADLTLTTSSLLKEYALEYGSEKTKLLPNGVNFDLFHQALEMELPKPKELEGETREIIIYTGAIGLRIDYQLIKELATAFQNKLILMVGPKTETYEEIGLEELGNVKFVGAKSLSNLPAYLKYSACAIIPFKCNELTQGIYPLKINEYLAAGKPVVSTNFSPDINLFDSVIQIAQSHYEFVKKVEKAFSDNSEQAVAQRVSIAKMNSWKNRNKILMDLINGLS